MAEGGFIGETSIKARLNDYDWKCAFELCGSEPDKPGHNQPSIGPCLGSALTGRVDLEFTRADVVEIIAIDDGEADERDWLGLFKLSNGLFAFVAAGCDYTGWDCRSGGNAVVSDSLSNLISHGMGGNERERLAAFLPPVNLDPVMVDLTSTASELDTKLLDEAEEEFDKL